MKTINDYVYGHTKAKKAIQVLLNRSQEHYYKTCMMNQPCDKKPLKCLLIGQSGTGKTHLVNSFKAIHKFPFLKIDATTLTPTGCSSGIDSKALRKLIIDKATKYCNECIEYHSVEGVLHQMVIFVDEFDKLGGSFESTGKWNQQVQSSFLTLIEEFKGLSWIFAGAFSSLYQTRTSRSIGFFADEVEETNEITDKDILKSGIIPEMLGRISLIIQLDSFTKDDYCAILKEKLLPNYGHLDSVNIEELAEKAYRSGQGIRSLTRQLEMLSIEVEYEREPGFKLPTF